MKQNEIDSLTKLPSENFENIFNVYTEENNIYFYNLLQTISFPTDLPAGLFDSYSITYGDSWPLISYKNYSTPNLWWVILLANQIDNPTNTPKPGKFLAIPKIEVVKEVLAQVKKGE